VEHLGRETLFHIVGELEPEGLALVEGGRIAIADIATMQEFTGVFGSVDRIDLLLRPSAARRDLEALRASLPAGTFLESPTEEKRSGNAMIRAYQLNLSVLSFVSLFVGMFLIYSLVALNARSRRRELAILRSLGATPRLLFLLFLTEGGLFGLFGWIVALPISTVLVRYLISGVSRTVSSLFVRVQVDRLRLDPAEAALSLAVTLLVSVLAAYQPAREAMGAAPREAIDAHGGAPPEGKRTPVRLAAYGLLLIASVPPLSKIPGIPEFPLPGYIATFLLFAGASLLSPWLLQLTGSHLPPLLRRLHGEPAYLAGRYVRDAGARTAISVGALITAMALFVALAIMVHSFRGTVETWANQSISGDLFLRPKMAEINKYRTPIPEEAVSKLESLRPRVDLLPYRRIPLLYEGRPYHFEPIDAAAFARHAKFLFVKGSAEESLQKLQRGEGVFVSEVFANKTGLTVGARFRARIEGALFDLPILAVIRDYRTTGGVVSYSLDAYAARTGDVAWSGVRLYLANPNGERVQPRDRDWNRDAEAARLRTELLRCCAERFGLDVTSGNALRREILRIFDQTFAITTVLLLIALLVAALGIATTLTVLVLERRRELNTLLAVGASLRQIRTMIFWESFLMVGIGEIVGLGCGFILSWILIYAINRQSFGWTFLYSVDWKAILLSLPLVAATALLAALPAIRLVFRGSPALALRE
jgi:putative ABC transport system permease protein